MLTLSVVFLIISLVLFVLAAIGVNLGKLNLIAGGLAFAIAAHLVGRIAL